MNPSSRDGLPPGKPPPATGKSGAPRGKQRVDVLLVERGLAPTRAKAQALVLAGEVFRGDERVEKPGLLVPPDTELTVRSRQKYVSRGGLKLEGALADLGFSPTGLRAADVGASTGGFTDCLLQHGAAHVYAIDVGQGQLAHKLTTDERVSVLDRTNARHLAPEQVGGGVELVVVDASFISLEKLLPAISHLLLPGGHLLALIKPQFEVGRAEAQRSRGVIRDPELRDSAISAVLGAVRDAGFELLGDCPCRVPGPKGNVEHFVLARQSTSTQAS
jgi:23S rRNA (cytidine1920-2'-O)/16S rRNA (cytidine1409-2'-O)-methyltransferase